MTTDEALAQIRKSICESRLDSTAGLAAWNVLHEEIERLKAELTQWHKRAITAERECFEAKGEFEKAEAHCAEMRHALGLVRPQDWKFLDKTVSLAIDKALSSIDAARKGKD